MSAAMKPLTIRLYWKLRIILLALRWIPDLNLGDIVIYNGKRYALNQGVCRPSWDMGLVGGDEYLKHINEADFKKECSLKNYWGSFCSGYRFYMINWFDIWVRNGIEPWMRGCNIWAKGTKK